VIHIWCGYDEREVVGFPVFCHSVLARTKSEVAFYPVRGDKVVGSTTFNAGRFDVARKMGYRGWAIFADAVDMLCLADVDELLAMADSGVDVMVSPHDYKTKFPVKFLGQSNPDYPGKNRTSLMLINCGGAVWERLLYLDPKPTLSQLHSLPSTFTSKGRLHPGFRVGHLPLAWNHLVSEYEPNPQAKLAHFTIGLPIWPEYENCEYAPEWRKERDAMLGKESV
jgi:hypothetical protein